MKKIKENFYFRAARNAEHYNLHRDILDVVTAEIAAEFGFTIVHSPYLEYFGTEHVSFMKNRRYEDTYLVVQKHGNREAIFNYLLTSTSVAQNLPMTAVAEAARRVYFLLEPHRNLARLNYASATASLAKLLTELKNEGYAADLEILGMTGTVESLYQENEEFRTTYNKRSDEGLVRYNAEKMSSIRLKVDDAARACFEMINALYLLAYMNGNTETMAALGAIIDRINALMLELQKTLSRSGVAGKPEGEEEDDEFVTDDETTEDGDSSTEEGDSSTDEGGGETTPDTDDSEGGTGSGNEDGTTTPPTTDEGDDDGEVVG